MGPKAEVFSKHEQKFDELYAAVYDLAEDIKETEQLSCSLAKDASRLNLFRARLTRLDSTFDKFRRVANEVRGLAVILEKTDIITEIDSLKLTIRPLYYNSIAVGMNYKDEPDTSRLSLNQSSSDSNHYIKLPSINIPTFSGDVANWVSFKDIFTSLIHTNPDLSEIQKYHYLKTALKGTALQAISMITVSAEGYKQAWEILTKRFDNKRIQATNYLVKIFNFKPIQRANFQAFEHFSEVVMASAAAFKNLNISDPEGFIIYTYALRLLDSTTRERFEAECAAQSDVPDFNFFSDFIHRQFLQWQASDLTGTQNSQLSQKGYVPKPSRRVFMTTGNDNQVNVCPLCQDRHRLYHCSQFTALSPSERYKIVKTHKLCTNCLISTHKMPNCTSSTVCKKCQKKHHTMLHFPLAEKNNTPNTSKPKNEDHSSAAPTSSFTPSTSVNTVLSSVSQSSLNVLLGTALARIKDCSGNLHTIRMVIDSGAQRSFITSECAKRLGLPRYRNPHPLRGFADSPIFGGNYQTECSLFPKGHIYPEVSLKAVVISCISDHLPASSIPIAIKDYFAEFNLADPSFDTPGPIDFLLGADVFCEILTGERVITPKSFPNAINTIFGWVLLGPIDLKDNPTNISSSKQISLMAIEENVESAPLKQTLQKFWELDSVPLVCHKDPLDIKCEDHFIATHSRDPSGHYIVRLPFKHEVVNLGDSYHMAINRFQRLESKLNRNFSLKQEYSSVIQEHLNLHYISEAQTKGKYFLPHHGVIKDGSSTKLRIVFDASAQTEHGSLNDKLLAGPKLQLDVRDVLLNFRLHRFAVVADIKHMYLQIWVHPEDRSYQHFFYRFNSSDSIKEYQINRVTFGLSCSPFLAIRVIQQLVEDEGSSYPLASKALNENIYIDDILSGADSEGEAIQLRNELICLLGKAGFELKKWSSNSCALLQDVPHEAQEIPISLNHSETPCVGILGLQWDAVHDLLFYKVQTIKFVPTKRGILSTIARMYDPLGYLAPVIFKAKTILQNLWKIKLSWDETINDSLAEEWKLFFNSLPCLTSIKIPRGIITQGSLETSIIGFADASSMGYAAVLYVRVENGNGQIDSRIVFAKTRLAPLKTLSIPRLELCAALLLVKTLNSLKGFINKFSPSFIYLLTDSTITLSWLRLPPHKLKTFVANRIVAILETSSIDQWFHVKSSDNAADLASRGILPSQLDHQETWWNGPKWLRENRDSWPISKQLPSILTPEIKSESLKLMTISSSTGFIEYIQRFSSYDKLIRSFSLAMRFYNNCKLPKEERLNGGISLTEQKEATFILIKATQAYYFSSKSPLDDPNLKSLAPFFDRRRILRVGGRLDNSPLPYEAAHPIILPPKAHFTFLILDRLHKSYLHCGPQLLHSLLQKNYWVISGRRIIRSVIHKCVVCHRFKAKNFTPFMAPLPSSRFAQGRAFINIGIDFAGPVLVKESQRRKARQYKSYVCVIVCLSTKAIHLDLVSQLTTDAFLACLNRFIGRRGLPQKILSDNGTNFIGANRKLKELYTWLQSPDTQGKIKTHLINRQIEWEFIPPASPHFGGIWEAGVKSFKYHLVREVQNHALTFEEFETLLIRIEAVLNSRPLHPMSSSPSDLEPLTPGHFIIGAPLLALPEYDLTQTSPNRLTRWQFLTQCTQAIWKRWKSDYLNTLQQRGKWRIKNQNISVNTLVILKDPNVPPLSWPAGRVTQVYPGPDGVVRVVKVKTAKGEYVRPVIKLAPLLPEDTE